MLAHKQNVLKCCVGRQAVPVNEISRLGQNKRSQEERAKLWEKGVTDVHTSWNTNAIEEAVDAQIASKQTEQGRIRHWDIQSVYRFTP